MSSVDKNIDIRSLALRSVQFTSNDLRLAIKGVRGGPEGSLVDDETILETLNSCLSGLGFLVVRRPRSNASSGTDPWAR